MNVKDVTKVPEYFDELSRDTVKANRRGETWSSSEDDQLRSEFGEKRSITEMSESHGRTEEAITSRLNRLWFVRRYAALPWHLRGAKKAS
ncbi:MAG: hypothetical protein IPK39_12525 [Sulfuritalea sp.]|nr:hypothetical protein [Sulfuritalea sp.]